jgi:hypothetical protein
VEWPFDPTRLQRSALEFHEVIHHVFQQAAVVPFRLLSIFDNSSALRKFAEENAFKFVNDLDRLQGFVQMESVIYVIRERDPVEVTSGFAYLEQKAGLQRAVSEHAAAVENAVKCISEDVRLREVKNGRRIFALVKRGDEGRFRNTVEEVAIPDAVSRRVSGPWPASEFLSTQVKSPEIAGHK